MNKIHKVIWSRCSNAFVVVSELARSRSSGGVTSSGSNVKRPVPSPLTALAAGVALAFGLTAPAFAQKVEVFPGNLPWIDDTSVETTVYETALQINGGAGVLEIKGGKFAINPADPDRAGDTNPYAAIWVKERSDVGDKTYLLESATGVVKVEVAGVDLQGVHVDNLGWLQSVSTEITATGVNAIGLYSEGSSDIRGGKIEVKGDNAAGVFIDGSRTNFLYDAKVDVSGKNAIGINVNGGGLQADSASSYTMPALTVTVTGEADADATGIRFNSGGGDDKLHAINITVNNTDGKNSTGILLENLTTTGNSITFAPENPADPDSKGLELKVVGNADAAATDALTRGIDVREDLIVNLTKASIDVSGVRAVGVNLAEGATAVLDEGKIIATHSGSNAVAGIRTDKNATLVVKNDSHISAESFQAIGISLGEKADAQISKATIDVNREVGASYQRGVGISGGAGATQLRVVDSKINVGRQDAASSFGLNLQSGADSPLGTAAITNTEITIGSGSSTGIFTRGFDLTVDGGSKIVMSEDSSRAISLDRYSTAKISDTTIEMQGTDSVGLSSQDSIATISHTTITMDGASSTGLSLGWGSDTTVDNATINLSGHGGVGIDAGGGTQATVIGGTKIGVFGDDSNGIKLENGASLSTNDAQLTVDADTPGAGTAYGIQSDASTASLARTTIKARADTMAYGIKSNDGATTELDNVTLDIVSKKMAYGVEVANASELTTSNGVSITAKSADGTARGVHAYGDTKVTLADTAIDVEGRIAVGVAASDNSALTVSGGNIRAKSLSGSEAIGGSSSNSTVNLEGATVSAQGIKSIGWQSAGDARFHMADSSIQSNSDRSSAALVLENMQAGAPAAVITGSSLSATATATHPDAGAIALYAGQSSINIADSTLSATGLGEGSSVITARIVKGDVDISDSTLTATGLGTDGYVGTLRVEGGNLKLSGSSLSATGQGVMTALTVYEGSAHIVDSKLAVTGSHADAVVVGIGIGGNDATLTGTTVEASGQGDLIAAVYMGADGTTLETSNQTRLVSSKNAILFEGYSGSARVSMTDTELVAGASTFHSFIENDAVQRIDLGSGVVATVNDGTLLQVERDLNLPTGRVELNIADGARVAGAIRDDAAGLADLTPDGGTYLAVSNADYAGSVQNVRAVTLANAARIGGGTVATPNTVLEDIHVGSDATLAGNWAIGGTLHASNGRVAPGNSIGVVTTHAIHWGPGTVYEVEVNEAGESDRVDVTGPARADISQTALQVMLEDGTGGYRLDHDYTILTAAGGIDGEFTQSAWQGSKLIQVKPVYQGNQVLISLSVDEQEAEKAAQDYTPNQRAVSEGALSVAGLNAAADAAFLSNDPAASFDMLSGEIHPSTRAGLMTSSTLMSNAILGRLRNRSSGPGGAQDSGGDRAAAYPLWVSYTHNQQTAKGDDNTAKRKHTIDSFSLGGDADVGAGWKVGGAFAYASSKVKLNERRSSSDIDSYGLALYAGNSWEAGSGSLNFMGGVGYTWHDISTKRNVDLGGAQTLKASYDARTTQVFGELGYALAVGERSTVEPYLGLTWLQHRSDGFSESGGEAALKGASGTDDVTFSTLGLRTTSTFQTSGSVWSLRAGLGWRHAFGDREPGAKLSFIQGGGSAFTVVGAPIARNTAVFDLGAEVQVGRRTTIGLGYEGQAGSGFTEHAGSLYLKTRF